MIDATTGAPSDYTALFEHYTGFVRRLVRRAGIDAQDVDDVTHEILLRFMEKDCLSVYDPTLLHDVPVRSACTPGPAQRTARFPAFLRGWTMLSVRGWLKRQRVREQRAERTLSVEAATERMVADVILPTYDNVAEAESMIAMMQVVAGCRAQVSESGWVVLSEMLVAGLEGESLSMIDVGEKLGVSAEQARKIRRQVRRTIREMS